ncbi:heme NO-binding domain-containing protein [Terasakiella pusilla]|uniref:heme NO-binding domain-containing protein n=1 Tax=Terasakiella pusilla TaxID=64973 RepID=UPI003AA93B97
MLGAVFTEFLEMVEERFSYDLADKVLENAGLGDTAAFTAVGNYDHKQMVKLVVALSEETGTPIDDLIKVFGAHLFGQFVKKYPMFFADNGCSLDFLEGIEDKIHRQVLKLYPNAELPKFDCVRISETQLEMTYTSTRPFGDLAHGLITGCGEHFNEPLLVERVDLDGSNKVQFNITKA